MNAPRTVGIIGTGLIGGSIGLRARQLGLRVLGCDNDSDALAAALRRGAIDAPVERTRLYEESETVVLAMPLNAVVAELEMLNPQALARIALLMDVASVKIPVVSAARRLRNFVGTHPMAGSEESGPSAAHPGLFEGKTWAYVPGADESVNRRAADFIRALGAAPVPVEAEGHDATVACTSHMPQVFAWLFAARLRELQYPNVDALCGPVAHELLRVSRSSPSMWNDVLDSNAHHVARELRAMAAALNEAAESPKGCSRP